MKREILTFNYPEAKSVVVCGDIHGAFEGMVKECSGNTRATLENTFLGEPYLGGVLLVKLVGKITVNG